MSNYIDQFSELLSNPLGELITSIGKGVGEAQAALDAGSLAQTLEMYREDESRSPEEKKTIELMREIGYQPTFYTIPETECEAQVSLSLGVSGTKQDSSIQSGFQRKAKMFATPLNAGNINRYNLNAQASAKLKFKIVPVPTDAVISEMRILPNLKDKTFSYAKGLLESLGLNYSLKLPENKKEEDINDEDTVLSTNPAFDDKQETRLQLGDIVELVLQ